MVLVSLFVNARNILGCYRNCWITKIYRSTQNIVQPLCFVIHSLNSPCFISDSDSYRSSVSIGEAHKVAARAFGAIPILFRSIICFSSFAKTSSIFMDGAPPHVRIHSTILWKTHSQKSRHNKAIPRIIISEGSVLKLFCLQIKITKSSNLAVNTRGGTFNH